MACPASITLGPVSVPRPVLSPCPLGPFNKKPNNPGSKPTQHSIFTIDKESAGPARNKTGTRVVAVCGVVCGVTQNMYQGPDGWGAPVMWEPTAWSDLILTVLLLPTRAACTRIQSHSV